ncbi:hypothetical protein [Acinetobacter johnsonii]|jgi:hypothetical protein|uniref:Uncharacterized protein n=1 Tax=Acinetobacter johnsonii TaxID=40214 RepID=A0AAJ6LET7_ACIJO|nr:hypothetical protein [Acinetobacter johnsonii]ALV73095.1 hypothetical protein RZ95_09425 [Acinetobacter johnsonii XBB1]MDH1532938.1 hypothetical protein [Acinetobacter johnsonii]WMG17619.1 hypothetical protein QBJ73_14750 [Acinetobacter johnsonii]
MEIHLITVKSSSFDGLFLWRLDFIRSGLNFNAAIQIFNYIKARSNDWAFLLPKFGNHIL